MYRQHQNKPALKICDCGTKDYRSTLDMQLALVAERKKSQIPNTVLIVEHPDVITLGARRTANLLNVTEDQLTQKNIDLVKVRRGGGVTCHNPGQLVFYPIINIAELNLGINEYIRLLETIGIQLLDACDTEAARKKGYPGLWVGPKKIASIGVRVSKGTTYHGMAININNDLSIFDLFVPCGIEGVEITSVLKETEHTIPMDRIKKQLSKILVKHFADSDEEMVEYETCE